MTALNRAWARLTFVALSVAMLGAAASATVRVPVYGDDFRLSQQTFAQFDGSIWDVFTTAATSGWQANRFNPVGRFFAFNYHFWMHESAVLSGIGMHWFYRAGSFVLLLLLVLSASYAFKRAIVFMHEKNEQVPGVLVFASLSAFLALTLQLHPWSHDPTMTISEIGLASGAISFFYLGLCFRFGRSPGRWSSLVIALVSAGATMFYETTIAAIVAGAVVWAALVWRARRHREGMLRPVMLLVAGTVVPLLVFVLGRMYVATMDLAPYPGTELALRAAGFRPMAMLLLGMIPGTAWGESASYADGISFSAPAMTASAVIVVALILTVLMARKRWVGLQASRSVALVAVVFGILALLTLIMHAFTEKYISEITKPGQIYLSYTMLMLVTGMLVLGVILRIRSGRALVALILLLPLASGFVVVQQAVDWSVAEQAATVNAPNRSLMHLSSKWEPDAQRRCSVLEAWQNSHKWPAYYVQAVTDGVQKNYRLSFGIAFCPSLPSRPS
ncbi:hypothetical protein [Microbacterium sp.]|uniref:hypothetical protein n=1 Tax=Microbacterium sp. TaxID=51671 RepID=UPI003A8DADAE